eukprot:CAMPEP_0202723258 /NCGR_PEP_ID=MMETSP1385-20130828/164431_1 /ASSEMBLY_ACC=CAM_ASM_000861 /TAXON_ID=933848 /ORGANISM="Elphidium margaritaceum" /LENGTH=89 /DNA_ID=CAMNT_0049388319 /DNA_START=21 /DNA_END=287 /DNA_ORIENTATION=-
MDLIWFDVFQRFSKDNQTIDEALKIYTAINAKKIDVLSKLAKHPQKTTQLCARKIEKYEQLCKQEEKYSAWLNEAITAQIPSVPVHHHV